MRNSLVIVLLLGVILTSCTHNNVTQDDSLGQYFKENNVEGTFALYNNTSGDFTIYNLARYRDSAYLPASTFKIVNSLIAIEKGVASSEKMVIPWDGVKRRPEWDKDLTMEEAFKVSCVPYYQEIARRIGKDTMQFWLDSLHYGNIKIKNNLDTFWLDNSLKITADEELGLVEKLYFTQLPFQKRTQDLVRKMMLQEGNANYQLSYKTGWGTAPNGQSIGWTVGWIEENRHVYFFVMNLSAPKNADLTTVRLKIVKEILSHLGFFKGRK